MHITSKLIKLWRVLRAFSFKTRCNLRESDKILNICKKSWDFLDNLLNFSPVLLPLLGLPRAREVLRYMYFYLLEWYHWPIQERAPGRGGRPPPLFFTKLGPRGPLNIFLRPPPLSYLKVSIRHRICTLMACLTEMLKNCWQSLATH